MLKKLSRLTAVLLALSLTLILACINSCSNEPETRISNADDNLTYGDTLGQDADEMMELLENS